MFGHPAVAAEAERLQALLATVTNLVGGTMVEPSVEVKLAGGVPARTVLLRRTQWALKDLPQSADLSRRLTRLAMALPESERLAKMDRFDDFSQIWLVAQDAHPTAGEALKESLPPCEKPSRYHREVAFLGRGAGFAWYGHMPIYDWTRVQKELSLANGDDPLAAAVRGVSVSDTNGMTRNSCAAALGAAGDLGIPHLRQLLATTNF